MSRRHVSILILTGLILALVIGACAGVGATQPGLVGTWKVTIASSDGGLPPFEALQTFHADGTMTETSSLLGRKEEGPAHGVWVNQGNDFNSTFYLFIFDPESGEHAGMVRVRATMKLDAADHLTARYSVDVIEPDGNTIPDVDSGGFEATRLKAEPPSAASVSGAPAPPAMDAIAVVQAYYDAFNSRQLDLAASYIADDAEFINPTGVYEGKATIEQHLRELVDEGLSFQLSDFKDTNGRVTYAYKVLINDQVLDEGSDGLTIVRNGKIVFDGTETTGSQP